MAERGAVAIVGGSGLIGGALASSLLADGAEVRVLTRHPGRARVPAGARVLPWSPTDAPSALAPAFEGCTAVVNLAGENLGEGAWTAARQRVLEDSRIRATDLIVAALAVLPAAERPRALVNASGIDYYGDHRGDESVAEKDAPGDTFLAKLCLAWEEAARRAEELDVRVVRVRTGFALARQAPALAQLVRPFRLFAGGPVGGGRQWFSWIHLDDLVGIYRLATDDESLRGPINAVAPDPRRERDLAELIGEILRRPALLPVPAVALRLALGLKADLVLHGRRAVPEVATAHGYQFRHATLEEAPGDALRPPAQLPSG